MGFQTYLKKKIIIALWCCFMCMYAGRAQDKHWHFENWGAPKDDPDIECISEDRWGNIWIGTRQGVYRLDGHEFTPLNEIIANPDIPTDLFVAEIFFDFNDKMWFATYHNGLFCFDPHAETFKHIRNRLVDSIAVPGNRVYGLHQGTDSLLVFSMHGEGIARYHEETDSFEVKIPFVEETALIEKRNFQLMLQPVFDRSGLPVEHWYSTLTSLVEYIPKQDTFIYHHPKGEYAYNLGIRHAVLNTDSIFWASSYSSGLWSFNAHTHEWKNHRVVPGPDAYDNALNARKLIFLDDHHILFTGNKTGLIVYHIDTDLFTPLIKETGNTSLPLDATDFFRDSRNVLWISSHKGLLAYNITKQQFVKRYLDGDFIDLLRDPDDQTLYALDYEFLYALSGNGEIHKTKIPRLYNKFDVSTALAFDSQGDLWVGTEYGIFRYNKISHIVEEVLSKQAVDILMNNTYFRSMQIDHHDRIWLGSQKGTILRIDLNDKNVHVYDKNPNDSRTLQHNYVTEGHCIDSLGNVWFRGETGISYYDQKEDIFTNTPDVFTDPEGLVIEDVEALTVSPEGHVFFGVKLNTVYQFLSPQLDKPVIRRVALARALPNTQIRDMVFDERGRLWMSCDAGIACVDFDSQTAHFYGISDGIVNTNRLYLDSNQDILASTDGGFYRFHPDSLTQHEVASKLIIRHFNVFDKPYLNEAGRKLEKGDTAILSYSQNFFSFSFADVSYQTKKKWKYAYKLEGLDEKWVESGFRSYAAYTNIGSGEYSFKVRAQHSDRSQWTEPVDFLHIKILPPFWEKPWFISFSIAILLATIYGVYRYRIKALNTKQDLIISFNKQIAETEMKALRAQMNPHFMFNVLNAIKLNVQRNKQDDAIDFITAFSKLMRSVLQNSEKKNITLSEELEALNLYIRIEQKRFKTEFIYTFRNEDPINLSTVMIPPLLLQPYVENAIWHGIMHKTEGIGKLTIVVSKFEQGVSVTITDNGIGRVKASTIKSKSAMQRKSMGMKITSDRVRLSEQAIHVHVDDLYEGTHPSGTRVVILLNKKL